MKVVTGAAKWKKKADKFKHTETHEDKHVKHMHHMEAVRQFGSFTGNHRAAALTQLCCCTLLLTKISLNTSCQSVTLLTIPEHAESSHSSFLVIQHPVIVCAPLLARLPALQLHTHTLTHPHTLTIACTCCYDEIKGAQDQDLFSCSFSDSLLACLAQYTVRQTILIALRLHAVQLLIFTSCAGTYEGHTTCFVCDCEVTAEDIKQSLCPVCNTVLNHTTIKCTKKPRSTTTTPASSPAVEATAAPTKRVSEIIEGDAVVVVKGFTDILSAPEAPITGMASPAPN